MLNRLLFFSAFLLLIGCKEKKIESPKVEPTIIASSFHNTELDEWTGLYFIKKDSNAHSGNTVAFIDSSSIYSMCYVKPIKNIKSKINFAEITYWALLKNNKAKAKTVLTVEDPRSGKNIIWMGNPLEEKVKEYNKWVEIKETFELQKKDIDPENILKLYVLNGSKEEILLDDFKVTLY